MKTFNFYVDQKHTVWVRNTIEVKAETMEDAGRILVEQVKTDLEHVLDSVGDYEVLSDTLEPMEPEENGGCSTVEVMQPNVYNSIYDNSISMADKPTAEAVIAELLAALEEAQEALDVLADDAMEAGYPSRAENATELAMRARAAIAKAKGGAA